jgi:hypothetical protein
MERRRKLSFTLEETEVLCQQAAADASRRAREEMEWILRVEMARATQIAQEVYKLRSRLSAMIEVGTEMQVLRDAVLGPVSAVDAHESRQMHQRERVQEEAFNFHVAAQ